MNILNRKAKQVCRLYTDRRGLPKAPKPYQEFTQSGADAIYGQSYEWTVTHVSRCVRLVAPNTIKGIHMLLEFIVPEAGVE